MLKPKLREIRTQPAVERAQQGIVLTNPETVHAGVKSLENGIQKQSLEEELLQTTKRLEVLDIDQEQLLQWALKGFPEDTVIKENTRINHAKNLLKKERWNLKNKLGR